MHFLIDDYVKEHEAWIMGNCPNPKWHHTSSYYYRHVSQRRLSKVLKEIIANKDDIKKGLRQKRYITFYNLITLVGNKYRAYHLKVQQGFPPLEPHFKGKKYLFNAKKVEEWFDQNIFNKEL